MKKMRLYKVWWYDKMLTENATVSIVTASSIKKIKDAFDKVYGKGQIRLSIRLMGDAGVIGKRKTPVNGESFRMSPSVPQPSEFATMRQIVDWTSLERLREIALKDGNHGCKALYENARSYYLQTWEPSLTG